MSTTEQVSSLIISDLPSGNEYLAQLSLANPERAEQQLMCFLDALLQTPPSPDVLFALLEQTRAPLCFVEEEMARCYYNKSLPLWDDAEACFQKVLLAWEKMSRAYALCARLEIPNQENPAYQSMIASVLHRCIYYTGMIILEHYRARRELPEGVWLDLHGYFDTAETWGIANTPVEDALESTLQATHCTAAYITLLLIDLASPYSTSVRNLNLIRRWAGMWAPLVSVHRLDDEETLPPYIVELMKDLPLHPCMVTELHGSDARRLDTLRVGLQISHMLAALHQRSTPSQLGLGEETSSHVIKLLDRLAKPWAQSASPRRFRRYPAQGSAKIAVGFEAMYFVVTGQAFEQPASTTIYSREDFEQLFTFRSQVDPEQSLEISPKISFPIDEWSVLNQSVSGFRLARSHAGQKIMHSQLLAVFPHDGEQYLLAQATWLMQEGDGGLIVGIETLPGLPCGVGVRPVVTKGAVAARVTPAFLLPSVPAIHEAGSIVLPVGLYQADHDLEIFSDSKCWQVRMAHVLQRGADFDRISFQTL